MAPSSASRVHTPLHRTVVLNGCFEPSTTASAPFCSMHTCPPRFWPDALATATLLVDIRPCRVSWSYTPHHLLYGAPPAYDDLCIFGCRCYPNTAATAAHKLAPRSLPCVFLGYPANTKGYRCYDLVSHRVLTSRHVYFDELVFPFQQGLLATPPTTPQAPAGPPVAARRRQTAAAPSAPALPGPSASLSPAAPPAPPSPGVSFGRLFIDRLVARLATRCRAPEPMLIRARAGVRRLSTRYPADQYVCTASPSAASAFWANDNSVLPPDGGVPSRPPGHQAGPTGPATSLAGPGPGRTGHATGPQTGANRSGVQGPPPPRPVGRPVKPARRPAHPSTRPVQLPPRPARDLLMRPPPPSHRCPARLAPPCVTRTSALPCRRSTMRCSVIGPGTGSPAPSRQRHHRQMGLQAQACL
ncbi:hypothetical protein QYE76_024878 [Lolium multiflorum]|uniref:Retroviral polymerase SH3-like domain-containing protein n=1 Tax=Lolium multiflorum TaxID=4521 RepID=A0AAD8RES1_LOLMU|nr:hypothetical protein QYE76_024878 [Lolium multiflorum]